MISYTIGIIIELYLCRILSKELNINLIPPCSIRWTCIGKERRNHTIIFDRFHAYIITPVTKIFLRTILSTRIRCIAIRIICNRKQHLTIVEIYISSTPGAIAEHITIAPTIRFLTLGRLMIIQIKSVVLPTITICCICCFPRTGNTYRS